MSLRVWDTRPCRVLRSTILAAGVSGAVCASALAQGVDGHGLPLPAVDAAPRSALTVLSPWADPQGSYAVGGVIEYADEPVVQYQLLAPDDLRRIPLLDDLVSLDLSARYAVLDRVGLGLSLPVFLTSSGTLGGGAALGDAKLWFPVGLVLPDVQTGEGLGVSVVPSLTLPTGASGKLLGNRGPGVGTSGVIGYGLGPLSLDANIGLGYTPAATSPNQQRFGGTSVLGGLAVGVLPAESWSIHLENRWSAALSRQNQIVSAPDSAGQGATVPMELLVTVKGLLHSGLWATAGAGRGVTSGVGAARFRTFLGAGMSHRPAVAGAEAVATEGFTFRVLDPAGEPIAAAGILVGGRSAGVSGDDGLVVVTDLRWRKGVEISQSLHESVQVQRPEPGQTAMDVTLPWVPLPVAVRVQDQQGRPVDARVTAVPTDGRAPVDGAPGEQALALEPGTWRVEITADGYGRQARTLEVQKGLPVAGIEVVMLEDLGPAQLVLTLVDPEGGPVDGGRVLLDGQPVGSTSSGGDLEVGGLAAGTHALSVLHEDFTTTEEPGLELTDGPNPLVLTLRRVPGSVKVVARGPDGAPVSDAVVRFDGPRRLPPTPLGERGERIQALGPGTWTLMVTSAEHGVQQREILVPPDRWELIVVEVVLQPGEQGDAILSVRVVDPDGLPIEGVEVLLDEQALGTTSTGGTLKLQGLQVGPRALGVAGSAFRPRDPMELFLVEGLQEEVVTLDWLAGTVRVSARHPDGMVGDAVIRWIGPEARSSAPLGSMGEGVFLLPEGSWTALATSETWGVEQATVAIPPDSRSMHRIDLMMNPDEGGLADLDLRVVDPDGIPVAGVSLFLDGTAFGTTTNTGTFRLEHLSVGRRVLELSADLFSPVAVPLQLLEGPQEQEIALQWAPGTARVRVTADGAPVTDAVLRMVGPEPIRPAPVDLRGERMFALAPGAWQAVAVSASKGIAQGALVIDETSTERYDLELQIAPQVAGMASLLVRVVDPDGGPVQGAAVLLGGQDVGYTGPGGALLVDGLTPGPTEVSVASASYESLAEPLAVELGEGSHERVIELAWLPGTLQVSAVDDAGRPVDAEVRLVGPSEVPAVRTGAAGVQRVAVRPGTWQVIASTDTLGPARGEVEVTASSEPVRVELVLKTSRVAMTEGAVVIKEQVQFDFGKATLRPGSGAVLDEVANAILANPMIVRVEVQGHTDSVGEVAYNQALSQQRAEAVLEAVVARGAPPEKLVARGYGTQRPIADNDTEDGRAANRRVEFEIVEQGVDSPTPRPDDRGSE